MPTVPLPVSLKYIMLHIYRRNLVRRNCLDNLRRHRKPRRHGYTRCSYIGTHLHRIFDLYKYKNHYFFKIRLKK
jgi:hypothetical protein